MSSEPGAKAAVRRARGGARRSGWLPRQHGAWAIVAVPSLVGMVLAAAAGEFGWWQPAIFLTWVLGYFAFNACSGLVKAPARRRSSWYPAAVSYSLAALAAGLLSGVGAGWSLLGWLAGFLPLAGIGLGLARRRRERSLAGGLLTVLAGCAMVLVMRFPDPWSLAAAPDRWLGVTLTLLLFGYFGGSVFYVKTMIRERGSRGWLVASLLWHGCWLGLAWWLGAGSGWVIFFAALAGRAWYLPLRARRGPVPPLTVGLGEVLFSLLALGLSVMSALS